MLWGFSVLFVFVLEGFTAKHSWVPLWQSLASRLSVRSAPSSGQLKEQRVLHTQVPHGPVYRKWHCLGLHMCTSECQIIIKYPIIKWHKTVCKERDRLKPETLSLISRRPVKTRCGGPHCNPSAVGLRWADVAGIDWSARLVQSVCSKSQWETLKQHFCSLLWLHGHKACTWTCKQAKHTDPKYK